MTGRKRVIDGERGKMNKVCGGGGGNIQSAGIDKLRNSLK